MITECFFVNLTIVIENLLNMFYCGNNSSSLLSDKLFEFIRHHYIDYLNFLIKQSSTIMEYSHRMDLLLEDVLYVLDMENRGQSLSITNAYGYDSNVLVEPYADTDSGSIYQSDISFSSTEGNSDTNDTEFSDDSSNSQKSDSSVSSDKSNDSSFSNDSNTSANTESFDFEAMGIHYDGMEDDQHNSKRCRQLILPLFEIPQIPHFQQLPPQTRQMRETFINIVSKIFHCPASVNAIICLEEYINDQFALLFERNPSR